MRIASRVIGGVLALAGLVLLAFSIFAAVGGFDRKSVLDTSGPDKTVWTAALSAAVFGAGFLLAGRYFFKLDIDAVEEVENRPPSRFAPYFLAHRRELKFIAQLGLVVSMVRLIAAFFRLDWSGRWAAWLLILVWIGLFVIDRQIGMQLDGDSLRPALIAMWKAVWAAYLILIALWALSQLLHQEGISRILNDAFMVLLFAYETLYFAYGATKALETPGTP